MQFPVLIYTTSGTISKNKIEKKMKRCSSSSYNSSIASPSSITSSSSSSSSSSESPDNVVSILPVKPKAKRGRIRKQQITDKKCSSSSSNSARRSSIYRGVTRHRWTGRFEAHLWDKDSWNNIQSKKGRQVYLGAHDSEEDAARTYDLAALKYWGTETTLNFPINRYEKEIEEMNKVSKEEYLASLRRRSSGFSRGVSKYRGVARHHHNGRWEARIGRVFGNKYLYLGTYETQEEAAAAYDMAALEHRGTNAVTNFDISRYIEHMKQKGILFLDRTTQEQTRNSNEPRSIEAEEVEQQQQKQQQQQRVEEIVDESHHFEYMHMQLPPCIDESTIVRTETMDSNELAWSFCMDSGLTSFFAPDFTLDKTDELSDSFDDVSFDLLFDFGDKGNVIDRECLLY